MRTLSPIGRAYITGGIFPMPPTMVDHVVVLSYSAGIKFPVKESYDSLLKRNSWIKHVVVFYEETGEYSAYREDVLSIFKNDAVSLYLVPCNRFTESPRPFVGPKVCTYLVGTQIRAKSYLFVDLDLWHFESSLDNMMRAESGVLVTEEFETSTIFSEMFCPNGIYNGRPDDLEAFPGFDAYRPYYSSPALNTGYLVMGWEWLRELERELLSSVFEHLAPWQYRANEEKFIGNREQALVTLALLKTCGAGYKTLGPEWNIQLVRNPMMYRRPNGMLALMHNSEQVKVLHFNGYAAPHGPARKQHEKLLKEQTIRDAALG